jgi:hypothetical protein
MARMGPETGRSRRRAALRVLLMYAVAMAIVFVLLLVSSEVG